ncbi:MAG: SHOCT domain-containing protein [Nitrososphaera sp.]
MNFLNRLRKASEADDDNNDSVMEYQENMDGAYRKAARDEEEEASRRVIQQVHETAVNPSPESAQDRLARLDRMKAEGLLTDIEYEQLKRDVKK